MEPEPLGKLPEPVVLVETLNRWGDAPSAQHASVIIPSGEVRGLHASPFPCDDCINQKLILWDGDISSLEVDAIVNSTNESMNDINPASASIFRRAGPRLREEIKADVKGLETGNSCKGLNLEIGWVAEQFVEEPICLYVSTDTLANWTEPNQQDHCD
ncbi:hypothetical protein HUJ05_001770 [Dendroctonus ponderosae]|nr:hypothetical protein HUJ05_001770 [Dendroctonus ponderosae]